MSKQDGTTQPLGKGLLFLIEGDDSDYTPFIVQLNDGGSMHSTTLVYQAMASIVGELGIRHMDEAISM